MPLRICASCFGRMRPTRPLRKQRSSAMICDTFATESFGKPVVLAERSTFPGAPAQVTLLVSGTHTAVAILLRFK